MVAGTEDEAHAERDALARFLEQELRLELSKEKTLVTPVEKGFDFLGYRVVQTTALRTGRPVGNLYIPKQKVQRLRDNLKGRTTRSSLERTLGALIDELNPLVRGWRTYYRHATDACREFNSLDWWLGQRVYRWLCKKHRIRSWKRLRRRYYRPTPDRATARVWADGSRQLARFGEATTSRYRRKGSVTDGVWNDANPLPRRSDAKAYWSAGNSLLSLDPPMA